MLKGLQKSKLNICIDIVMFLLMMGISGIGFLVKFVLIPGFERNDIYGRDVELMLFDMNRHQWGKIHLILGLLLIVLLVVHLVLHYRQVKAIMQKMIVSSLRLKVGVIALVVISLFLIAFPIFVSPDIIKLQGESHNELLNTEERENTSHLESVKHHNYNHESKKNELIEIYGYMTLNEVAEKYNLKVDDIAKFIHVPKSRNAESLGRLRKSYDFKMGDLKSFITENKQKKE